MKIKETILLEQHKLGMEPLYLGPSEMEKKRILYRELEMSYHTAHALAFLITGIFFLYRYQSKKDD